MLLAVFVGCCREPGKEGGATCSRDFSAESMAVV